MTTVSCAVVSGTVWTRVAVCGKLPLPLTVRLPPLTTECGRDPLGTTGTTECGSEPLETTEWGREPLGTTEWGREPLGTTEWDREPLGTTEWGKEPLVTREVLDGIASGWGKPGGASSFLTLPT